MTLEIARRLGQDGVTWETVVVDEATGGGSLPDPITTPLNVELAADDVALSITAATGGGANLVEITPDNPRNGLVIDGFGRFLKDQFTFLTTAVHVNAFSLLGGASFELDNDDTGDPILKVTAGTPNTVEINGVPYSGNGFPVSLDDGDDVRIASSSDATTRIVFQRGGAGLSIIVTKANVLAWSLDTEGVFTSAAGGPFVLPNAPEVPSIPTPQDIVDALVTLGLVTQAA